MNRLILMLSLSCILFMECTTTRQKTNGVVSYKLQIEDGNSLKCGNWNYPDSILIYNMLSNLREQNVYEIHDLFDTYSCRITGEIIFNGREYKYYLNAGGYITLEGNGEQLNYGCEEGMDCEEYFLSRKLTKEEWKERMKQ